MSGCNLWRRLLVLMLLVSWSGVPCLSLAQDKFQPGDRVQVEFMGKQQQGEVTKVNPTGWPTVKFEYRGREREIPFPPNRVKNLGGAPGTGDAGQMDAPLREWTDSTGKFKIQASLKSFEDGTVSLLKEDGRVVELPLEKLSDADQQYLLELAAQSNEENPFAGGKMTAGDDGGAGEAAKTAEPSGPAAVDPDWSGSQQVLAASGWSFVADPGSQPERSSNKVLSLPASGGQHSFHNRVSPPLFSLEGNVAACVITNPFEKQSTVVTFDLDNWKTQQTAIIAQKDVALLAVAPGGRQVVTHRSGQGRDPGSLEFWDLENPDQPLRTWKTAGFGNDQGLRPIAAYWLDADRLLTLGNRIGVWNIEQAQAEYSMQLGNAALLGTPAFSPGGKQVAVNAGASIFLVECASGKVLGQLNAGSEGMRHLALSPQGNQLAAIDAGDGLITIWNLETQEKRTSFGAAGGSGQSIAWVDEDLLLVNGTHLMSVPLRATVWNYRSNGGTLVGTAGAGFWITSKTGLSPITLPHRDISAVTAGLDADDLLIIKPGVEVELDLDMSFSADEMREIRDHLESSWEANGVTLTGNSDLKLVGRATKGEQDTVTVTRMGIGFGRDTVNFRPTHCTLELQYQGQTLWKRARTFAPGMMINMKENESTQQAVNRLSKPDPSFVKSMRLPRYYAQLPESQPAGNSEVTESGIR